MIETTNDLPTPREVLDKLNVLGSARQIADFFEQEQVVGEPQMSNRCPVAVYVQRETGMPIYVDCCSWHEHDARTMRQTGTVPDEVAQFVVGFDSGFYPALEKR